MNKTQKIAVAMSGGVDSSVAALILKKEGHQVIGVNLNLWSCFKGSKVKTCCSPEDRNDARRACEKIGIPFVSIDMREEFKDKIILQFVKEYSHGRTPNPCIICNSLIKFDSMLKYVVTELGCSKLATGHYARISHESSHPEFGGSFTPFRMTTTSASHPEQSEGSPMHLLKGLDSNKDQTYFLFDIPRANLSKLIFPLGALNKDEVRKIAKEAGLSVAEKKESQEVCFIPDNDVASFIEDFYPDFAKGAGNFVDADGKVIGRHRGSHAYTIGQRRGLGIGFGKRKYVTEIRAEKNEVVLGEDEDLLASECVVSDLNMLEDVGAEFEAEVKIRYATPAVKAKIVILSEAKNPPNSGDPSLSLRMTKFAKTTFSEPVRAITPGQAAVFYDGDMVIGGGWIL